MPGSRRSALLVVAGAVAVAVPCNVIPTAASAASAVTPTRVVAAGCASPQAAAPVEREVPWPQKRYPPERLEALATGDGVTVAVIDSGVDPRHPQLSDEQVLPGRDYLDGRDARVDCAGHGTAVAGIIAASPQAGAGPQGIAPGATILPVRVSELEIIDNEQNGRTVTPGQFARSIRWAVDHDAHVLNLSVVLYRDDPAVRSAVEYAIDNDVVVVAAVGNLHDNGDPTPYPAAYDEVIGVGSIGPDGTRSPFSQVGPYVDLVAPGGDVPAPAPAGGHQRVNGTSFAAPFVSATAALIREYRPELSARQVAARILATTDPAPGGRRAAYGAGALNPIRAVADAVAAVGPRPVSTLRRAPADPATLARAQRRAESRQNSLSLAGALAGLAGFALLVTLVVPHGARRRWRPPVSG
jgi:membrane-anchored mycosin MYCP